jgi:hypothetical protein
MKFEKDVFISYAHLDNQPLTAADEGWVSRLHASLSAFLGSRMGRQAEIWRDMKLQGNDIFADEIVAQLPKTAVLVAVLTPRYVNSDWCRKEAGTFCEIALQTAGLVVDNKSRVFKVIKTPVESQDALPSAMKDTLGFEFYTVEHETPLELDSAAYGPEMIPKYNKKVAELAFQIAQLVKKLGAPEPTARPEGAANKPVVYLAECSYDRRDARDAVQTELHVRGYTVLPERGLPREEAEYTAEVTRLLAQCSLSVHLVGNQLGAVPDGPSQKSIVILQNELAAQQSKSTGFPRVIWLPEGSASTDVQQQRFIEALHQDADAQAGADLITADLEALKSAVQSALQRIEAPKPAPSAKPEGAATGSLVYLICDARDRESKATLPLRKHLKSQGIDVEIPPFEGDAATVRQAHLDELARCDAVMVFYGAGDEAWKRTVDEDLRKARGARREKLVPAPFTYLAEPATPDKSDLLDMGDECLVDGLRGFDAANLSSFLRKLKRDS